MTSYFFIFHCVLFPVVLRGLAGGYGGGGGGAYSEDCRKIIGDITSTGAALLLLRLCFNETKNCET